MKVNVCKARTVAGGTCMTQKQANGKTCNFTESSSLILGLEALVFSALNLIYAHFYLIKMDEMMK